jgi:hypothetical protein
MANVGRMARRGERPRSQKDSGKGSSSVKMPAPDQFSEVCWGAFVFGAGWLGGGTSSGRLDASQQRIGSRTRCNLTGDESCARGSQAGSASNSAACDMALRSAIGAVRSQ